MIRPNDTDICIRTGELAFTFMNSGDIRQITYNQTMINQLISNPIDGSMNNIFLRIHRDSAISFVPLLGIRSSSRIRRTDSQISWTGHAEDLEYEVIFTLTPQLVWFWDVRVHGHGADIDLVYGQDVGIADQGAVRSNEAYLSQYIDHSVFQDPIKGWVVCSRQNMPQQGQFPYLQQGALTHAAEYATDGFQFFGLSYKATNKPEALTQVKLPSEIYQYEFAYTALQSKRVIVDGMARFVFYGLFKPHHPDAVVSLAYHHDIEEAWAHAEALDKKWDEELISVNLHPRIGEPLLVESLTLEEIERSFPSRHQEEWENGILLSFFTEGHEHVVLKEKELLVERPHGHILMTGDNARMNEHVLTTTSYMYGIFNSQLVVGNTSANKILTNARNALNVLKTSGQRIYIELHNKFRMLTMPSMYEIGFNYVRWTYKTADDTIIVTNLTTLDTPEVHLTVQSASGAPYRYLVTNQVTMNNNEYGVPSHMEREGEVLVFRAGEGSDNSSTLPDLCYRMKLTGADVTVANETALADKVDPSSSSLVVLELSACPEWSLTVQGLIHGEELPFVKPNTAVEIERYRDYFGNVMNGFQLSHNGEATEALNKVNALAWWYTHNMLVHYSVPHGLEQYGGAAWGTRDVCQGPTEYFMATQKYEQVREIIKTVYAHQYEDDGNWPQWFMFDQYYRIQQEESHGDIIVWPLKVVADYISATHDYGILQERIPYTQRKDFAFTDQCPTLLEHVQKQLTYMKNHFLHGTHLSAYGDGDWDDTLQPANAQLKQYMISSWTVALTYQVLNQLSAALTDEHQVFSAELAELAVGIQADFNHYMLQKDVIPGFVYMEKPGEAELMLHPTDTKTGIQYRLLPMTRSMIAELLTEEQAESHYRLIKQELYCPDGVRLMNRPARYAGGVSTHFKRAEQASNFGREVGLQYVHAHIRFVEAMAKLGKVDEAWLGLAMINPIGLREVVPNAELRQSNAYFSSSDGKFNTRYDAQERFQELIEGKVPVKGGWRIYSSGPGIYMNQLISNCLGIRQEGGDLIIDPVLPTDMDGLRFDFAWMNRRVSFEYHISGSAECRIVINGHTAETEVLPNRYRHGGTRVRHEQLANMLSDANNVIAIYI
ncbi:cellobiose phosphorylase [Paenibacillus sp. HWE-109]|uniref:GH36-type glycosyl hydrolase domain-containing protein n=1 Tax=Paenibacillus sp. HWE-109 TaxID=1306526 RepID=UPI001EDD69E8|nr:cellobiose phosphorylase [Paenibacillus sp. HWE-109]UKS27160.1 cellobiose phosphorylase [Paenibacillus sp. HWE-109]